MITVIPTDIIVIVIVIVVVVAAVVAVAVVVVVVVAVAAVIITHRLSRMCLAVAVITHPTIVTHTVFTSHL